MQERTALWQEGQLVDWPKVVPYTITKLVGEAGNIHISETGRWHVFWHRELTNGRQVLVHHGGPEGFADLTEVKHQHERILLRYTGIAIPVPADEQEEVEPRSTFPEVATQLKTLEIPGEQQSINHWIEILQRANRDLPQARTHTDLGKIKTSIGGLLEGNLGRSINRYKRAAAQHLEGSLQGNRAEMLLATNEAQRELLLRAYQIVAIWMGTARRYNDLERLQMFWNETVERLPHMYAGAADVLVGEYLEERRERRMKIDILHPTAGVFGLLSELKGEPYHSKALQFIESRDRISQLWEARNLMLLAEEFQKQAAEAQIWKQRVREQYEGVDFGKYSISNQVL